MLEQFDSLLVLAVVFRQFWYWYAIATILFRTIPKPEEDRSGVKIGHQFRRRILRPIRTSLV